MVEKYYRDFLRRVELSEARLNGDTYRFGRVFREKEYYWEGDWEGRALLAFVCLKRLTGRENPTLAYELSHLKEHTNEFGYFGKAADGKTVSEQQLSGNGWYLRGLCEYYEDTKSPEILRLIESVTGHLYLANEALYRRYPEGARGETGGVSGCAVGEADGWKLSSDVGCAFIALDGLTAAYRILKTERLKNFIDERIAQFLCLDKLKCRMQTHATLTVCRAILRMYLLTAEKRYLASAEELFDLYLRHGMTLTYENFNWFCREDTWTEPCAVTDSLIAALYLYRETGGKKYLKLARRIYFNGFCMGQRRNGGAGPNSCVTKAQPYFGMKMYEAEFCCSMRYAEGLYHVSRFAKILFEENDENKPVLRDGYGRYFRGDHLLCADESEENGAGGDLKELPDVTEYTEEELKKLRLKVVFAEGEKRMTKQYLAGSEAYNTPGKHVCAPIFRRKFSYRLDGGSPTLRIYATGFYRLFLNGKEITKGYFAPYISNPDELVYYDDYQPGEDLKDGENELFVLLGNGFTNSLDGGVWDFESASYRSAPKFYLELTKNGETILRADERFEVCDSPIVFDDYRCGERYDARNEGLDCNGLFTGRNMRKPVPATPPRGREKRCEAQPIKEFERIRPVAIRKAKDGYIYDFGVNFAGIAELNFCGEEGQKIELTFGEVLQNGELDIRNISFGGRSREGYVQHDEYICKAGKQVWKPCFTYHGFQYVYVRGITAAQATEDLLTYIVLHSDIPVRGRFLCGNETLNGIQHCTIRSDFSNFYYFPTDCPQREKNGWTGDAALSAEQLLYNFDCEASLREWLFDIRAAQRENGALPGIVPTGGWGFEWGNGPAWDDALIEITYQLYRFGGDKEVLKENEAAIEKYVDYLYTRVNENGQISFGLGDWLEAGAPSPDRYATPTEITDTLTCVDMLRKAAEMYRITGNAAAAEKARVLELRLCENFKNLHIKNAATDCVTQTAQAMALRLGMFENKEEAYRELKRRILADGRLKAGILGAPRLLDCLCDYGDGETAVRLLTDENHPGYAHNLQAGATTLWEDFQTYDLSACPDSLVRKDGGGILSLNHHCWGSVSGWFYRRVAGLNIKYVSEAEIAPCFVDGLGFAEAEYARNGRYLRVKWQRTENETVLAVENRGFAGTVFAGDKKDLLPGVQTYKIPSAKK